MRGARSYPSLQGRLFLSYVPLIPYFKIPYERLDESYAIAQRKREGIAPPLFPELVAQALVKDLVESGLASRAFLVRQGEPSDPAHLLLGGELRSTAYDIYATSYMLGVPGVLLWLLPIPAGWSRATVDADLRLVDSSGDRIWECRVFGESTAIRTLYNSGNAASTSSRYRVSIQHFGRNAKGIDPDSLWAYHSDAMRKGMEECRPSLAQRLETYRPGKRVSFTGAAEPASDGHIEERLRRLRDLFEEGLISRREYQRRRSALLDEL